MTYTGKQIILSPRKAPKKSVQEQLDSAAKWDKLSFDGVDGGVITINKSATLTFTNSTVERVIVRGESSRVRINGLKIYGEDPLLVEGFRLSLIDCTVTSTSEPLTVLKSRLTLEHCKVSVTCSSALSINNSSIKVKNSSLSIESRYVSNVFSSSHSGVITSYKSKYKVKGTRCRFCTVTPETIVTSTFDVLDVLEGKYQTSNYPITFRGFVLKGKISDTLQVTRGVSSEDIMVFLKDNCRESHTILLEEGYIDIALHSTPLLNIKGVQNTTIGGRQSFSNSKITIENIIFPSEVTFTDCNVILNNCTLSSYVLFKRCTVSLNNCTTEKHNIRFETCKVQSQNTQVRDCTWNLKESSLTMSKGLFNVSTLIIRDVQSFIIQGTKFFMTPITVKRSTGKIIQVVSEKSTRDGLNLEASSIKIRQCKFDGCKKNGICASDSSFISVSRCGGEENIESGIYSSDSHVHLKNSTIFGKKEEVTLSNSSLI